MTHVVNLLPWRDLRRRQRLRYVLLLTIGIVLLGVMGLLVSRTARLQRDFLATLHTTADAQLLASLKQREQAMREAWQQHQRQRQQYQRRSAIAAWQPRLQALAADLPAQAWLTRLEYQGVLLTLDGLALNLQAESVTLHFADAEELAKSGGKLLSARGHLMADKRTNRLLIRDDARHLPALKAWAQEMDLPVGQVELAAHIVSMSETSLRELGVKWRLAEAGSPPGSGQITTLSSDVSVNDASTRAGFNIGKINGRLLELELSALERKQQVEIIASPRLLASHMQPASIKQGSEIPYQVSSGESGATSVEFKEAVLGMEVTPTVLQQGRVRLKLRISENTPGQVLKQENGEALAIDKQEIETLVEVRSGETLALGGIFSQKNKTARDSVPLLGDIPVLGRLFRRDGKDNERRELVVFITPRILAVR
nr:DNA uptake porin HofQ [Klebsiella pneumoniae]